MVSLEAARGQVWAIRLRPDGLGPQLVRGRTTGDALTTVMDVPNRSGFVIVSGDVAYVVGTRGAGPVAPSLTAVDAAGLHHRRPPPCPEDSALGFDLAAASRRHLVAVCFGEPSAGTQRKSAFRSDDGGSSWRRLVDPPAGGYTSGPGGARRPR